MEKGTSIVSTEEYMRLLEYQKAIEKEFMVIHYYSDRTICIYSKEDFEIIHKEEIEKMRDIIKKLKMENDDLKFENFEIISIKKKSNEKNSKFGWESFIRGTTFGIGISCIILSIIYTIIK